MYYKKNKLIEISTLLIGLSLVFVFSCSNPTDSEDTQSPTIKITFPDDGALVPGLVDIVVETSDNEGVTKVEFYIDDQLQYTDSKPPWNYSWNTTAYADSGQHTIYTKAFDEAGNSSSSSVITVTLENSPPAAITDLTVTDSTITSISFTWTSPGDNGNAGTASEYDLRYYISAITESNWGSSIKATGEPTPQAAGNTESVVITGLNPSTKYHFAVRTKDSVGNISALSNIETASTKDVFGLSVNYSVGSNPHSIFSTDLDNDNDYDLVVANKGSDDISILMNNGNGTFQTATNYSVKMAPVSVYPADLNNNGYDDLAVVNVDTVISIVSIDTTVSPNDTTLDTSLYAFASVLFNDGAGTFQIQDYHDTTWYECTFFAFGQCWSYDTIDVDTLPDTILVDTIADSLSVDTTYSNYQTSSSSSSIIATDFDGNGYIDLATANDSTRNVSILLNNGDGTFQTPVNYSVKKIPSSIYTADFDGDGINDLVVSNSGDKNVSVLINDGNGTFQAAVHYKAGVNPSSVFAADFDGDGSNDIVVTNTDDDNASILFNNGDGTFKSAVNYFTGNGPSSVFAGDITGDGADDLVITNGLSNDVSVLSNKGIVMFWSFKTVSFNAGNTPIASFLNDFDNDGDNDLAVVNNGDNTVTVFMNLTIE